MSAEPIRYVIDPFAAFPKRWRDAHGPLRVMGGPVEGWLMVRRPGSAPFVLQVCHLLNAKKHFQHGPFTLVEKATRR